MMAGERPDFCLEAVPISRAREVRKTDKAVANRAVAIETIEENAHTVLSGRAVHAPVQIEIRRGVWLVEMPQNARQVAEGAELIASTVMRLRPALPHDGVDEMPL